jgi:serine protease AprX
VTRCRYVAPVALAAALLLVAGPTAHADGGKKKATLHVVVRLLPDVSADPNDILDKVKGNLEQALPTINGFSGFIPPDNLAKLQGLPGVLEATTDATLNPQAPAPAPQHVKGKDVDDFVASDFAHSSGGPSFNRLDVDAVSRVIGADDVRADGVTGAGIDVALIDTGVAPVPGAGAFVNGPDLSFDSQVPGLASLDAYGHGTHLAGIINGNGHGVNGVAPGARIVNVKVGAANGAVDVVQVIAAIDWVVQHRNANGMNIRVLALAYGTDSTQSTSLDPLAYAAEVAWQHGIVVVAAAGNTGTATPLLDPAADPYVLSVGAADVNGTYSTGDDTVPGFSASGTADRGVDVVAPGRSVVSLRDPNSFIDVNHPEGVEPDGLFRGSGTSQATAVVAGAVALMLQDRPTLSPDDVKWLLRKTARTLPMGDAAAQGTGEIDVKRAVKRGAPGGDKSAQTWTPGTGMGSLEASRGSMHVQMAGVVLQGEMDIFGTAWDGQSWSGQSWSGQSWSGDSWLGQSWSGQSWSGQSWSGQSWSGQSWSGQSWSGQSWSGQSWSGQSWSGQSWSSVGP